MTSERKLTTVNNLPSKYPDANFTPATIRWLIYNRNDNGFDACIVRMGRKVLIDIDRFESWLDEQAVKGCAV